MHGGREMNRRKVVKSLLILPILGFLKRHSFGQDPLSKSVEHFEPTFNLIFHGPFCFYRLPDGGYLAAAPDLKSHDLCYSFELRDDKLKDLSGDQYVLAQTKYSTPPLINERQILVLHGKYELDPGKIRCHIYLPAPLSIQGIELYRLESPAGSHLEPFQGRVAKPLNQCTHLATATLFAFERKDGGEPFIRDLWDGKNGDKLHFLILEKQQFSPANPNETFQEMIQAVKGLELNMALAEPHKLKPDDSALPKNIAPSDLLRRADLHRKGGPVLNCLAPGLVIQE